MTRDGSKRLYERRWLWIVVASLAAIGGISAAVSWRISVKIADPVAQEWIRSALIVRATAGEIKSIEVARIWSKTSSGFHGVKAGRIHYVVHGTKEDLDLLVLWSKKTPDAVPTVDKVQWIDKKGFDTIWSKK